GYTSVYRSQPVKAASLFLPVLRCVVGLIAIAGAVCAQGRRSAPEVPSRTVAAALKNPFASPEDVQQGGRLFQTHCSYCHGSNGEGGRGADLTSGQYRYGSSDGELFSTIREGIPGSEMPPVRATDDEIWRMVGFVSRIGSSGLEEKARGDVAAGKRIYEG